MKKVLTLLTLLCMVCTGAWAADPGSVVKTVKENGRYYIKAHFHSKNPMYLYDTGNKLDFKEDVPGESGQFTAVNVSNGKAALKLGDKYLQWTSGDNTNKSNPVTGYSSNYNADLHLLTLESATTSGLQTGNDFTTYSSDDVSNYVQIKGKGTDNNTYYFVCRSNKNDGTDHAFVAGDANNRFYDNNWNNGSTNQERTSFFEIVVVEEPKDFEEGFYRFYNAGKYEKDGSKHYVAGATATTTDNEASAIFYVKDGRMLQYSTGQYMKANTGAGDPNSNESQFSVAIGESEGTQFTISNHANQENCVKISSASDRAMAYWDTRDEKIFNHTNLTDTWSHWYYEKVASLPVTIASSGYTTFYTPVNVTVPADATAYAAHVVENENDGTVTITYVPYTNNVIPACQAALIEGVGGETVNLTIGGEAGAGEGSNLMTGNVATIPFEESEYGYKYYTLQNGKFQYFTGTSLKGFKAFLVLENDYRAKGTNAFRITFEGKETTTGLDKVADTLQHNKAYDLTGRTISTGAKGISIVNGVKVIR